MIAALFSRDRDYSAACHPRKRIKINGILFTIRKINPLDYLVGFNSLHQVYSTYKRSIESGTPELPNAAKIKKHYRDVIMSGVVEPKLTLREEDLTAPYQGLHVEALFNNWEICESLYGEILSFTYGKKKAKSLSFQKTG